METEDQTSLKDFFSSVREGGISGKNFFKKALLYDETREYLKNHPDTASRLLSATAENEQTAVREVVEATQRGTPPKGAEGLGQFKPRDEQFAESRPRALSPKDIADITELAGSTVLRRKQEAVKKLNISEKVDQFAKNLRQQQRDELLKSLSEPIDADTPENAKKQYLESIDKSDAEDKHELKSVAEDFFQQTGFHEEAAAEVKKTNDVIRVVVENAAETPKIFTESFLQKVASAEDVTPTILADAERSARFTTFVASPKNLEGLNLNAFTVGAKSANALEKTVENLSFLRSWDAFDAWKKTDAGIAAITKSLGENVVSSDAFHKLLQDGNRLATDLRGGPSFGGSALRGAEGLMNEIFTAPPSLDMLNYLEALHASGETSMNVRQFFEARLFAGNPTMFHFDALQGISLGFRGAGAATGGAGVKTLFTSFSSATAKKTGSQLLIKIFPFLGAGAVEVASGPVGWAGLAATTAFSLIGKAVKAIFSPITGMFMKAALGVAGGILGSFNIQQANQKRPPGETTFIIMAIVLAPILLLFVLAEHGASTEIAAIPTNVGAGPGGPTVSGAPEGEAVVWAYGGNAPISNITNSSQLDCPVRGGTVSQGPNGSFSHRGIQAYDIFSSLGAPIYATHDAYVVSFHDGIAPYTFINNSYGNYVLLVRQLTSGSKFFTIYGHLLSVAPIVQEAKSGTRPSPCKNNDTSLVCKGEIIGYEDATGSTWGSGQGNGIHLHYQSQGLGNLILPAGCP